MGQRKGFKHRPEFAARLREFAKRRKNKKWHASVKAAWTPEKRAAARAKAVEQWKTSPLRRAETSSGTKPELAVADALKTLGLEFRPQEGLGGYWYDFAVPSHRTLIEVDGCYWHNCVACGHEGAKPGVEEIDARKDAAAKALGWRLIRIPEHDVKSGDYATTLAEAF